MEVHERGVKRPRPKDAKEMKREQKRRKMEKRMARPNAEIAHNSKLLWEKFRKKNLSNKNRSELMTQALTMMDDKILEMSVKKDTSRVIQTILKYGFDEHKQIIFEALKDHIIEICKNRHAHFLVVKMLKYGNKEQKTWIIKAFYGQVRLMVKHKYGSVVLEHIYTSVATSKQKHFLLEDFYGHRYAVLKTNKGRTYEELIEEDPEAYDSIIESLYGIISAICDKVFTVLTNSIVHFPLLKFFEIAPLSKKIDLIGNIREHMVRIAHTRDGAKAAILAVGYGKAKDRKIILRSLKGYVGDVSREEYGYQLMLKILNSIDDTVMVNKLVLKEIKSDLLNLSKDKYGRLPILYILCGNSTKYLTPFALENIAPTMIPSKDDPETLVPTYRKDDEVRRMEHFNNIIGKLVEMCEENALELLTDMYGRHVFYETVFYANDEQRKRLVAATLEWICFDPSEIDEETYNRIKNPLEPVEEEVTEIDLLYDSLSHRIIRNMISNIPNFGNQLLEKIADYMEDYALHEYSVWVVTTLVETEETAKQTKELLVDIIPKIPKLLKGGRILKKAYGDE
eukprot:TRINITY_DN10298_c0_g1_i1.p1 TRINITY_DN10298_c0_g1~~TRINITY_DN10298_c0_g1_i1.p1  ORF type:complete len:567 (-),score=128.53 TRINITY_DN10298_c0_g1_i1:85-1785(-)